MHEPCLSFDLLPLTYVVGIQNQVDVENGEHFFHLLGNNSSASEYVFNLIDQYMSLSAVL